MRGELADARTPPRAARTSTATRIQGAPFTSRSASTPTSLEGRRGHERRIGRRAHAPQSGQDLYGYPHSGRAIHLTLGLDADFTRRKDPP